MNKVILMGRLVSDPELKTTASGISVTTFRIAVDRSYVKIGEEKNDKYRSLLQAEYRYIKSIQEKIRKNALEVYKHKIKNGDSTGLAKRCNDFIELERLCKEYNE